AKQRGIERTAFASVCGPRLELNLHESFSRGLSQELAWITPRCPASYGQLRGQRLDGKWCFYSELPSNNHRVRRTTWPNEVGVGAMKALNSLEINKGRRRQRGLGQSGPFQALAGPVKTPAPRC